MKKYLTIITKFFINEIVNSGISKYLSVSEKIALRNANLIIFFAVVFAFLLSLLGFYLKLFEFSFLVLFCVFSHIVSFFLIRWGWAELGKILAWFFILVAIYVTNEVLGSQTQFHYFSLIGILFPLVVHSYKSKLKYIPAFISFVFWLWVLEFPRAGILPIQNSFASFFHPWVSQLVVSILLGFYILQLKYQHEKNLEELESQNSNLIRSSQMTALGEMAGGIAHEINNPLQLIVSKAEKLIIKIENDEIDKKYIDDLKKIESTAWRISKIIKGLRIFSRTGDTEPFMLYQLSHILDDTLDLCHERFATAGVQLRTDFDCKLSVFCNPVQMSQVFLNLLNNALDAVRNSTATKWVEIKSIVSGTTLFIYVTDSGLGIPFEVSEKMMNPFFTTKEIGKGTGLGLSVSRGIIESHGGKLYYDSHFPNTRFVIELPKYGNPIKS